MVSHQLVEQWRVRLVAWQDRLDEGRPRPWLARAYLRVLSYLLAQYAPAADAEAPADKTKPASQADAHPAFKPSAMIFGVAAADLSGKAPRTQREIRSVLHAVHTSVPRAEEGPLVAGLRPDDPIVVTAFYSLVEVERLARMLEAEGIGWEMQRLRRKVQVVVRMADLDRAKTIVSQHALDAHDSPRWRYETVPRYGARGGRVGLLSGLVLAVFIPLPTTVLLVALGKPLVDSSAIALLLALCLMTIAPPFGWLAGCYLWGIIATHKPWRRKVGCELQDVAPLSNRCNRDSHFRYDVK
ncbi:MAG TPA: hypothetical protein VG826_11425 [Pirellulales bacterium]|nr:hypothetical protein [Pirellulales bacterium]